MLVVWCNNALGSHITKAISNQMGFHDLGTDVGVVDRETLGMSEGVAELFVHMFPVEVTCEIILSASTVE